MVQMTTGQTRRLTNYVTFSMTRPGFDWDFDETLQTSVGKAVLKAPRGWRRSQNVSSWYLLRQRPPGAGDTWLSNRSARWCGRIGRCFWPPVPKRAARRWASYKNSGAHGLLLHRQVAAPAGGLNGQTEVLTHMRLPRVSGLNRDVVVLTTSFITSGLFSLGARRRRVGAIQSRTIAPGTRAALPDGGRANPVSSLM